MSARAEEDFLAVYRRFAELPEDVRAEIVAGEVRLLPRPRPRHVRVTSRLGARLEGAFGFDADGPRGWVLLVEPEIRFEDELRAPDLAGWRTERYVEPDDGPFEVAPDWICEVLSPSTARTDRAEKMPLYARCRVGHLWLIDPEARTLEVYRRHAELWLALPPAGGDAVVRAEPFEAIALDLGALWRTPG
ncbi:MAG: Uma2 family endonuclease [Sandaracinaceae bacterium]|nr:Uma2 family endonuclease [Sandaracinaceae bacterium]